VDEYGEECETCQCLICTKNDSECFNCTECNSCNGYDNCMMKCPKYVECKNAEETVSFILNDIFK
jgi:hypothetical protein